MDKAKKKRIRKYVSWVCMVAFVALLAAMPLLARTNQAAEEFQASILSGTVQTGSVATNLYGGGTLSSQSPMEITLPEGVKITEFLVSNGDAVRQGDALAVIDRVSLMETINAVQETMDYLLDEMADTNTQKAITSLTAKAGGNVKLLFAQKGDDVQDVMLEHGALAVLSLDGLMAVRMETSTGLITGDAVTVTLDDGTEVPGRVESNMDDVMVVTVEDDGYAVGQNVTVTDTDGNSIGTGTLYVYNAWNAVAYSGTVESVNIKEGTNAYAGQTIFSLKNDSADPQQEALATQHRKYEAMMLKLFQLYQSETVTAPCNGMVSGVDKDSIFLLAAMDGGYTVDLLANAPGADPDGLFDNHVGQIIGKLGSQWMVTMDPESQEITDYKTGMEEIDTSSENQTVHTVMDMVTVYKLVDGEWEIVTAEAGDLLLFALGNEGFVWAVHIGHADTEPELPTVPPTEPEEDDPESTEPVDPDKDAEKPEKPDSDKKPESSDKEEETPESLFPSFGDSISGMIGGFSGGFGGAVPEEEFALYPLEETLLLSVIPQEEMTLNIQLSEWDIAKVQVGMTAEVTVEALQRQIFPAVITEIADTGIHLGGSSQFTVTLTLQMQENMLAGMSATATIPLYTTENVALIPVEALVEDGTQTLVYTAYDESTGELLNPVEVTLGESDGQNVQILSGLETGDAYWYSYYDTLEIDHSVEEAAFPFG